MVICESERLIIRHFTLSDTEFIIKLLNEESFIRYIADKNVRNVTDAKKHLKSGPIASYEKFGFGLNMVILKDSEIPIGMCGLLKRNELDYPDLGYAFLPKYCKKGYALEAAKAVLEEGITKHSLDTVLAVTLPTNISSNRLLQKVGFVPTGLIELYNYKNNLYEYNNLR